MSYWKAFFKQFIALILALIICFGCVGEYLPVYASTSQSVKAGSSESVGSSYNPNVKGVDAYPMGCCIILTPVTNSVTADEVVDASQESGSSINSSSWAVEGYVAREESALALPSANQASLFFVSEDTWSATTYVPERVHLR